MATQAELVTVLQTEFERLKHYLVALPQDAWTKPSACALWEIRDVVVHLITGIEAYTHRITRARHGDTAPPDGVTAPSNFETPSQEERRQREIRLAQGVIARRGHLGNELHITYALRKCMHG